MVDSNAQHIQMPACLLSNGFGLHKRIVILIRFGVRGQNRILGHGVRPFLQKEPLGQEPAERAASPAAKVRVSTPFLPLGSRACLDADQGAVKSRELEPSRTTTSGGPACQAHPPLAPNFARGS